jgi:hypothetical protein
MQTEATNTSSSSSSSGTKGRTDGKLVLNLGRGLGQKGFHKSLCQTGLSSSTGGIGNSNSGFGGGIGGVGVDGWAGGEEDGGVLKKKEKKRKRLSGGMVGTFPVGGETEETVSGAGTGIVNTNLLVIPPTPALLPGLPGPTHYCQPTWPSYMFENDFREKVRF